MRAILTLLLMLPLLLVVLPVGLYLTVLTAAAPFGRRRRSARPGPLRRVAVLVPAHDEEQVLGRLLTSLAAVDYPAGLMDIHVVADNCTDGTVAVARAHGANVWERQDMERRGKGYALQWLLDRLEDKRRRHDAYIVLDADSAVSPNFLTAMNERLNGGAHVVQAYYTVLPVTGSRAESLREAALALVHYARPAAKAALGASCGLKGNGMCFDQSVLARFGWPSAGLAEDVEFHLMLVEAGIRVEFAPEAVVRAEMPASLRGSRTQNMRWEAGRLAVVRRQALPLLARGVRERDIARCDAALEQIMPPLSVPFALAVVCLPLGIVIGAPVVWVTAATLLAALVTHILAGLMLARVPWRVYRALMHAPTYVAWKAGVYMKALLGRRDRGWVRTERIGSP